MNTDIWSERNESSLKQKIVCAVLAAMLIQLTACSESETDLKNTSANESETSSERTIDPLEGLNFDGEEFNILYIGNTSTKNLIRADELNGDVMNDAIYERNIDVLNNLGVTVTYTEASSSTNDCPDRIRNSVMAYEDAYQMGIIHRVDGIADLALNNYLYNYSELPYIDLDAAYWNKDSMQIMSYHDKMFYGYSKLYPISTFCVFFNKTIAEQCGVGNLYDIVRSGDFTIDKMAEIVKMTAKDLDGNGEMTRDDQFGIAMRNPTILSGFYLSAGINLSENHGDSVELSLYSEKTVDLIDKVLELISDDTVSYMRKSDDLTIRSGQIMFYLDSLDNANGHRDSDVDFGLLPYPKYDKEQDEYISFANPNLQCVPITADKELAGAVIEYMAKHSEGVTEAFYEKTLKGKVAADSDSAEMVDLMMNNYIVDFATNYCGFSNGCTKLYNVLSILLNEGNDNFTSFYYTYAEQAQAEIDAVLEGLNNAGG